jgi:hypothetical protein
MIKLNKFIGLTMLLIVFAFLLVVRMKKSEREVPKESFSEALLNYSIQLKLDTLTTISVIFNDDKALTLSEYDFRKYRKDYKFKKAIILIVLKMKCYFNAKGNKDVDLLHLYSLSPFLESVIDEMVYMGTSKEPRTMELHQLRISSIYWVINQDKRLYKDQDISLLSEKCR